MIRRRYPGEITFVRELSIPLFDAIVKDLPQLSVLYEGKPVSQRLVLLRIAILNTGSVDISEEMVDQKLTFSLAEGYRWVAAAVAGASPQVQASVASRDRDLVLSAGLFRCNEFIRFQAIAEIPSPGDAAEKNPVRFGKQLDKAISISHRIKDTGRVVRVDLSSVPDRRKSSRQFLFAAAAFTVLVALICFLDAKFADPDLNFVITIPETQAQVEVLLNPSDSKTLLAQGTTNDIRLKIAAEELFDKYHPKPTIHNNLDTHFLRTMGIEAALIWVMYAIGLSLLRRKTKLSRLIEGPP